MKTIYTTTADFIQDSPAAIDRERGVLYINPKLFNKLTPFQRKFVKHHELGHYKYQTSDELVADAHAFDELAGTEFRSLKQALGCISEILDNSNPSKQKRYDALYKRALAWDYKENGNEKAKAELERLNGKVDRWVSNAEKNTLAMAEFSKTLLTSVTGMNVAENNAGQTKTNSYLMVAIVLGVLFIFYKSVVK